MKASDLNQRITFLQHGAGADALNQPTGDWVPIADTPTVWAKRGPVTSRDIAAGASHASTVDEKWTVRYRSDVVAAWRVRWGSFVYEIVGMPAALFGGTDWMEVRCRLVKS